MMSRPTCQLEVSIRYSMISKIHAILLDVKFTSNGVAWIIHFAHRKGMHTSVIVAVMNHDVDNQFHLLSLV